MNLVLETLNQEITRRRALWITPFAFGGLVAILSRRGNRSDTVAASANSEEVTLVQFNDAGEKLETSRVKKVVHPDAEWRKLLSSEYEDARRRASTDMAFTGTYYEIP